jgi:hypothetical protein
MEVLMGNHLFLWVIFHIGLSANRESIAVAILRYPLAKPIVDEAFLLRKPEGFLPSVSR